ncbi:MAG: tetratricopeptide repeat protein [Candidatus Marinimicrobia bacterium]|nr:tetratricopeptide repeat protein [Candidatus Neomarinimicrobiota bacterium]
MRFIKYLILGLLITIPALSKDDARKSYENGQFDEAIRKYERILTKHPDWEEAHFGKGAALYKTDRIDDALREFELAIPSKNPTRKSAALYNMGNALLKSNRLEESLKFYKRALELNPRDYDAKHNFELVRQMLQQQQQQKQQQSDKQDQQKKEQQKQDNKQNQQKNEQQKQDEKQDQQDQQKNEQQKQDEKQDRQQQSLQDSRQERREKQKSREEAAQVLDALKDKEKKMMQERIKTKYSGIKKEKDW